MRALNRILLRDAARMWQQGLAISALLACGIAIFVMSTSTMRSLELNRQRYYRDYRFGDVFVQMVRAPNHLAVRLAEIPGVERIQTRIVREVLLDMPKMIEPASCRLVSVDDQPALALNGLHLRRGRFPNSIGRTEVVISELFADAHGLNPGDELHCIMGGRRQKLMIVGVGLSPEYVYAVQPGLLLTDNRRFGIVWMPRPQMAAAFNMEGAFNNVSMILRPNVSVDEVLMDVDRLRVMGFSRREVSVVLVGELAIITLLAIPIGLPIGYGLSYLTTLALDTDTHRFPLVVSPATFAYATVVILLSAAFSSLYTLRLLDKLDLISVLKVKE